MLDFNKVQKKFLNVNLVDGKKLLIRMPTKKIFDLLFALQQSMEVVNDPETKVEDAREELDTVYNLLAVIMSNNIAGVKITEEYLGEIFDVEDLNIFMKSYFDFIYGNVNDPN